MINRSFFSRFQQTRVVLLTLIFLLGYANSTVYGVFFPDYFPLDATVHGVKTFQLTYGHTGSYQSFISGTHSVPYTSGAIVGTGVVNFFTSATLYATNDGSEVKWLVIDDDYISTDCVLTAHPTTWTFSTVTDDMLLDQGYYCWVDPSLTSCEEDDYQALLFDIQGCNVSFGQYNDCVIIWWIDKDYPFKALNFGGKDIDLGITLPSGSQTGNYSVTDVDVYAYGIGLIAYGDIEADTGELNSLAELVGHSNTGTGDIGLSVTGKTLPTAVVSGSDATLSLTAWIENIGDETFAKGTTVDFYFYARETTSDQYTEIVSLPGKSISNLKPGKVKKYSVKALLPAGLDDGVYEIVAEIDDDAAFVQNHTVVVQEGFIDLTMAAGRVSLPSAVIAGESAKTAIQATVTNTGNISTEKTARADFTVVARPAGGGDDIVLYETTMKFGNLKPGKGKKYNLKPTIPSDVPEGTYDVLLWCNYGDVGVELPLDHQIVVSEPFVTLEVELLKSTVPSHYVADHDFDCYATIKVTNRGNVSTPWSEEYNFLSFICYKSGGMRRSLPRIL